MLPLYARTASAAKLSAPARLNDPRLDENAPGAASSVPGMIAAATPKTAVPYPTCLKKSAALSSPLASADGEHWLLSAFPFCGLPASSPYGRLDQVPDDDEGDEHAQENQPSPRLRLLRRMTKIGRTKTTPTPATIAPQVIAVRSPMITYRPGKRGFCAAS